MALLKQTNMKKIKFLVTVLCSIAVLSILAGCGNVPDAPTPDASEEASDITPDERVAIQYGDAEGLFELAQEYLIGNDDESPVITIDGDLEFEDDVFCIFESDWNAGLRYGMPISVDDVEAVKPFIGERLVIRGYFIHNEFHMDAIDIVIVD